MKEKWKESTRYGKICGYNIKIGQFKLSVHHYIGCPEDMWFASSNFFSQREIGVVSDDEAKIIAIDMFSNVILETYNILMDMK